MKSAMHIKFITSALLWAAIILYNIIPLSAESVFLKDGSIVEGRIISDAAASVTIRMEDKKTRQIQRSEIMRILYTELKIGKIYIQKRDGKGIVAYMVDEDRESYTFRLELYDPAEFTLKRNDVLFMAEKNPSGLQVDGDIGTDRVTLTWLPPYDPVKKYNLYIKKNDKDKYELIESTGGKSITLKNLSSNTDYFIIVTSVDSSSYESSPSNEIKIKTKNIPPSKPVIISSGNVKSDQRTVVWNPSSDIDGKVEKYRIYGTKESKREIIAEIKKTEYNLKKALSYKKVELVSVDDLGDESKNASVPFYGTIAAGFQPGVIYPMGKFAEMFSTGYGVSFSIAKRDFIFDNIEGSISLGIYQMKGKDLLDEKNKDFENFIFMPLYVNTAYDFKLTGALSIKPVLSFGYSWINMNYIDRNKTEAEGREQELSLFEPAFMAGLSGEYRITSALSVAAGCGYGTIIEKSGILNFISANAGISYSF